MQKSGNTSLVIIALLVLSFPLWIALAGGLFGLLAGLFGLVIGLLAGAIGLVTGIISGIVGATAGIAGWLFNGSFNFDSPVHIWFNPAVLFAIALVLALLFRKKKATTNK
jgi:hypothetical protein